MPPGDVRTLSSAELKDLRQRSLRERLIAQAVVARQRSTVLSLRTNSTRSCTTPIAFAPPATRLRVWRDGNAPVRPARHRLAQHSGGDGRVLYPRPMLRDRLELMLLTGVYLLPLFHYGDVVTDEACILYDAALLGLAPVEFYAVICRLANHVGAESRYASAGQGRTAAPYGSPSARGP